ncbi:response regulator [Spirosoma aureum]|uniref:histidine kinase n=1 Tax=Spirosoma aureum TaxID=2692134 RepID=A0A6G9AUB3_9BACT|nr:ATP-binding protein [Spirosoma aureum]QIP16077.1 response regulator [Spirosoma aureum]
MRLVFFLFILIPFTLFAQPKGWQELTISNGLSQGMIFDLKQDQKGFLWIATKDGLNRYDGHNFKAFTHDPYNDYSISDNACSALLLDRHGRLWIGTLNKGLNLYDDRTQRFYHITLGDQSPTKANNYEIQLLDEDPEGNIWVSTSVGGSFKIQLPASLQHGFPDQANFTKQIQLISLRLSSDQINQPHFHFSFKANGQGITGVDNGVYAFNWRKPASFSKLNLFVGETPTIFEIYEDPIQDFLFVSTSQQIKCWHRGHSKTITLPNSSSYGVRIKPIDKNTLAITTVSHLWLLSASQLFAKDSLTIGDSFVEFPPNLFAITTVLQDRTGNIWAGTSGYGLRKFNPRVKQFHSYLPKTSLSQLFVDRQGRTYARYQFAYGQLDRSTDRLLPFLDERLPEADRRQRNIMQDRQGIFWVSNTHFKTHEHHLFKFSSTWQLLKKYPLPAGIEFGFWVNQTLEDPSGNLWIGAMKGKLLRFNPQTETFQVFSYLAQNETETYALLREPDGSFWIGTQQGLIKADHLLTKPTYVYYRNSTTNRQSLSNDFVSSLANDPSDPARYLWVGTKGGGLERLDKKTGQFEHFTEVQGLPNKVIYGILTDSFGHLWLSTNRGLSQFNPRTKQFRNYTQKDGLQDDEFNTGSFFKTASGELLFGGVNGLNSFRPSELAGASQSIPNVNIIGLKVNNKSVEAGGSDDLLTQGIEYARQLDLSHDQNLLTFEFGLMDYTNSDNNRYRYRLEGIDNDWVEAGTNRFANYAQLPGGKYVLAVMGSADGEVWSKPVELLIRIHPPFYRTWWAYLLYAIIIAMVGWQLYRFQTQRLLLEQQVVFEQKEASRLSELDALKTQFFTNISHEFRTPLTLILGPLSNRKNKLLNEPELSMMERNGHRLMTLINQLLDLSKLEAHELTAESEPGDIASFFRIMASSFSSLADSRSIQFSFAQSRSTYWVNFDRDKLEKIVTNLLSNAFKFTPNGHTVRMDVTYQNEGKAGFVTLRIEDTGIGIDSANLPKIFDRFYQVDSKYNRNYEGTGIGLALVNELVKVLQGSISVTSTESMGTTFTVRLPLVVLDESEHAPPVTTPPTANLSQRVPGPTASGTPIPTLVQEQALAPENVLLIIDDNADIRTYIRHIFEADFQVIEAEDGQDGLEKATAVTPTIVICDLMMPRLDGFGFCRILKSQEATSHIPVVMLTAKATLEDRLEGFELGADDYLTKPFNADEIRVRVRNLLDKQERLRHYFSHNLILSKTPPIPIRSQEETFLQKVREIIDRHLDDSSFGVDQLSQHMHLSSSQLLRKLKALTSLTTVEFLRQYRLERAAVLLAERSGTVSDVAYQVGFESLPYFTKVFQEQFGVLPSEYTT